MLNKLLENARAAQKIAEGFTQEQVDDTLKLISKAIWDHSEELAKDAVEETKMGCYEHKVIKNQEKASCIYTELKGLKSVGIIGEEAGGIKLVAKPMGVVCAVSPSTNPTITPFGNSMFALKARDAIIIAPHPGSKMTSIKTVNYMREALEKGGYPKDLIQIVEEPSIQMTQDLMSTCDVVVATGGPGMVHSAYSSGKPSYGVGPGNVQGIVDTGCNIKEVVGLSIMSRTFDNGVICAGNQSFIVQKDEYDAVMKEVVAQGGYYVDDEAEVAKFRDAIFIDGKINKAVVGKSVQEVAKIAGVDVPEDRVVIVLKGSGLDDPLCREKMCPVMVALSYDTFEEAIDIASNNLNLEGAGHSSVVYSNDEAHIEYAGNKLPVSRILVNQPGVAAGGNAAFNHLVQTVSLGCGSWGKNSISENLTYKHLMNISRIAANEPVKGTPELALAWD